MNILYFCNVNGSIPLEAGVYKKVLAQCKVLSLDGHYVMLACPKGNNSFVVSNIQGDVLLEFESPITSRYSKDRVIFRRIQEFILKNNINVVYSRYSKYSFDSFLFYKKIKKYGVDVILEIPTYPFSQRWSSLAQNIKSGHFLIAFKQLYNNTIGSVGTLFFKNVISHIVNNNGYDQIWGIPVLKIHNGIDLDVIPQRAHVYEETSSITVMSVANVAYWHGFDRLIKGLHEYYKGNPSFKVFFDLVGPGSEVEALKKLAYDLSVGEYVRFYGTVVGKDLDEIFERADIGVSILGIHRNKIKVIDCLKSREFCARKLPFITQDAEVHFANKRFAYSVPSDETPININEIIDFYYSVLSDSRILDEMYQYAVEECDWKSTFWSVRNYLLVD